MEREGVEDRPNPAVRSANEGHHDAPSLFGAKLKQLRRAARLTQEELASRAGMTAKAVSALERGERRRPYPHTVRALADAMGLPDAQRASLLAAVPARVTPEIRRPRRRQPRSSPSFPRRRPRWWGASGRRRRCRGCLALRR